jgi:parallel beta-helix repeat protein
MTRSRSAGVLAVAIMLGLYARSAAAQATTLVVSKSGINCAPDIAVETLYSTIQAAVDAMPPDVFAYNKVIVCPGVYPEQVTINKNITITGVLRDGQDPASIQGNSGEARIVPPVGGLKINVFAASGNVAAQVAAQNVEDLNLINLSIDGSSLTGPGNTERGFGCPRNDDGTLVRTASVALYNVGVAGAESRGTLSRSVVHNSLGYCADAGNPDGAWFRSYTAEGILAENSWFTLDSNALSNADLNIVHQTGGISIITNNSLNFGWHGIWLTNVVATVANVGTTVAGNSLTAVVEGVYLEASQNVLVARNTMLSWTGDGVYVAPGSLTNDIIENKIVDAWHGIYLFGAGGTNVRGNTIIRSTTVAIVDNSSHGGNQITGNTITQAPAGVFGVNTADDVINPNDYFATTVLTTIAPPGTPIP